MSAVGTQANSNPLSPNEESNSPAEAMDDEEAGAKADRHDLESSVVIAGENPERAEAGQDDEGRVPLVFASPGQPSAIERGKHKATHIPFRSWCKDCVRGRGRDRQHRLCSGYDQEGKWATPELPRVGMDYGFFSTNDLGEDCEAGTGTIKMTLLAVKETMRLRLELLCQAQRRATRAVDCKANHARF